MVAVSSLQYDDESLFEWRRRTCTDSFCRERETYGDPRERNRSRRVRPCHCRRLSSHF
ncbi:hypothetical protein HanIR_Chr17g0893041 [Helianthus annuus]|nr:hypothetical protein HanIR_Chr17g0893041 [Helianthus annuus]